MVSRLETEARQGLLSASRASGVPSSRTPRDCKGVLSARSRARFAVSVHRVQGGALLGTPQRGCGRLLSGPSGRGAARSAAGPADRIAAGKGATGPGGQEGPRSGPGESEHPQGDTNRPPAGGRAGEHRSGGGRRGRLGGRTRGHGTQRSDTTARTELHGTRNAAGGQQRGQRLQPLVSPPAAKAEVARRASRRAAAAGPSRANEGRRRGQWGGSIVGRHHGRGGRGQGRVPPALEGPPLREWGRSGRASSDAHGCSRRGGA